MAETIRGPSPLSVAGDLVLLFGLVLPWLGVPAVAGGIGYGVIRLVRARP